MKPKKCKACGTSFSPISSLQKVCSPACAIKLVGLAKEKKARKLDGLKKIDLRSRRDWIKLTQQTFNAYIRERDKNLPCISCGRHHDGQYHAGHYLTTGARHELRFDEDNCHKQCAPCNNHLSGNVALYRIALIRKIGLESVEALEGPPTPAKWTIDELKEIRAHFQAKLKALRKADKDKQWEGRGL